MKPTLALVLLVLAVLPGLTLLARVLLCPIKGKASASKSQATLAANTNVEQELKKLEQERAQASVRGDTSFLDQMTADDYTLIAASGELSTKAQMLAAFKSGDLEYRSADVDDVQVRVYADAAGVVIGRSTVRAQYKGQNSRDQYRYTRVYVKRNGRWQAVAFQATRNTQQ